MYAPPGAIDAPRPAAAEAAFTKEQRQKNAERRKHWLTKNAAPLPHRVIKGGLSKKQISDVLLFPRRRHTTLNKSLVNVQRAHERDRERTRLANLQAVLDAEQKKRDAEDLQAAKDAEKKFIKSDTEKKSSLLNSWRRYQGTHPMLDPDRMTLRNAARAAFTAGHVRRVARRGYRTASFGRGRGEAHRRRARGEALQVSGRPFAVALAIEGRC
jgi:hypothetical protein